MLPPLDQAIALARTSDPHPGHRGEEIFPALPLATRMVLTELAFDAEGDRYFPEFDRDQWKVAERRPGEPQRVCDLRERHEGSGDTHRPRESSRVFCRPPALVLKPAMSYLSRGAKADDSSNPISSRLAWLQGTWAKFAEDDSPACCGGWWVIPTIDRSSRPSSIWRGRRRASSPTSSSAWSALRLRCVLRRALVRELVAHHRELEPARPRPRQHRLDRPPCPTRSVTWPPSRGGGQLPRLLPSPLRVRHR